MTTQTTLNQPNIWKPHDGQQTRFLQSNAFEALFGGSASPGKTDCLLMESLRQIENPRYTGILFRRLFTSLEGANSLIQRSQRWFPGFGGKYNDTKHVWKFPSGARIYFGHLQHATDVMQYQSSEFGYVAFDELTEFLESQYLFMHTRARATPGLGLRVYVRAATNPGGIGHEWVKKRFVVRDIVNRKRYFATVNEQDSEVPPGTPHALSRVFYPALMKDNPNRDPEYESRIRATGDPVLIARLIEGDWDAEYIAGRIFDTWSSDNVSGEADYQPGKPVWWGCDDGYVLGKGRGDITYHPRIILFMQHNTLGGVNVFDEYVATHETHETSIKACLARPYVRPYAVYVDGSARGFRDEFVRHSIANVNGTHLVTEGIKALRRLVFDGNAQRLLKVHPRCENLVYEMPSYRTNPNEREKAGEIEPLKMNDHSIDALRYGTYHLRMAIR